MAVITQTGHVVFAVAFARWGAMSGAPDSITARKFAAWMAVMVMPCPNVGLKLTTASPKGTMPAGKRSRLS